jgi:hypothetical protein
MGIIPLGFGPRSRLLRQSCLPERLSNGRRVLLFVVVRDNQDLIATQDRDAPVPKSAKVLVALLSRGVFHSCLPLRSKA